MTCCWMKIVRSEFLLENRESVARIYSTLICSTYEWSNASMQLKWIHEYFVNDFVLMNSVDALINDFAVYEFVLRMTRHNIT